MPYPDPRFGPPCTNPKSTLTMDYGLTGRFTGIPWAKGGEVPFLRAAARIHAYDLDHPNSVYHFTQYGTYACRPVTGGTSPSLHSWPVAVDINQATNPYVTLKPGQTSVAHSMPPYVVSAYQAEGFWWGGWGWGGQVRDYMHFEHRGWYGPWNGTYPDADQFRGGNLDVDNDKLLEIRNVQKYQNGLLRGMLTNLGKPIPAGPVLAPPELIDEIRQVEKYTSTLLRAVEEALP